MSAGLLAERLESSPPVENLVQAAEWVTNTLLPDILAGRVQHATAVVLGRRSSRWELQDTTLDAQDCLRSIARHEAAFLVAFVHPVPLPPEVQGAERGWLITCEDSLQRMDVLVALAADQYRVFSKPPQSRLPRWVGREPTRLVDLAAAAAMLDLRPAGEA